MVAVIKAGKSLRHVLQYNENKLKENKAQLIHAQGFAKDIDKLGFTDKIRRFEKLTELNVKTSVNSLHISLNFDPTERLDNDTLALIADSYMAKIGFGDQPYLVYQHHDSGHPHIHIVSTNIQHDGSRISLHNIGRNQSEKARLEIEKEFKLVPAQREQQVHVYSIKAINAQKVQYGRSATKRAMTNVLDAVLEKYKYTSLPELNAILKQYNMVADRGSKESRVYQNNGLVYRVLNEQGEKVGVPIKASDFYSKPTLAWLEQQFQKNEPLRQPHKLRLKNAVDFSIARYPGSSLAELSRELQREKIQLVVRRNDNGVVYGITYIDHLAKCVFNGSDLGKPYSANQLLQRLGRQQMDLSPKQSPATVLNQTDQQTTQKKASGKKHSGKRSQPHQQSNKIPVIKPAVGSIGNTLRDVLLDEQSSSLNPALNEELRKKRKKKLRH